MDNKALFLLHKIQGQLNLLINADANIFINEAEISEVIPNLKKDIDQAIEAATKSE